MIPLLAYPELHFRFGGVSPSLLFKKEPEIIFDMVARVEPKRALFLSLIVHHYNLYPVELNSVSVSFYQKKCELKNIVFDNLSDYEVTHSHSDISKLFQIPIDEKFNSGRLHTLPKLICKINKKEREIVIDNLPTTSKQPLITFIASEPLPLSKRVDYADIHGHSIYSQSHVEFGAPTPAISQSTNSFGLSMGVVIDHSYDLECKKDNYLERDSNLNQWKKQQSEKFDNLILGEEISARKVRGGVVHLGAIGHSSFIKGSGDGARKGYNSKTELNLADAAEQVVKEGGVTFAAHPGERSSFLQSLLLRRGSWNISDFDENIGAFQAVNRGFDSSWYKARKMWISLLLREKKLPLLAGNDAHGDFNRYRAIGFPFLSITENVHRYFGACRTGFYTKLSSKNELVNAIKEGKTFITSGPAIDILVDGKSVVGSTPVSLSNSFTLEIESSREFGEISTAKLFFGTPKGEFISTVSVKNGLHNLTHQFSPKEMTSQKIIYCRVETTTTSGTSQTEGVAISSPVYFKADTK
jgi:hypothetical protein